MQRTPLLPYPGHGGARPGAGRKPRGPRRRVTHAVRPACHRDRPQLITVRVRDGLPNLRRAATLEPVRRALCAGADRFGLRLVQFSLQSNHIHFLAEVEDARALTRGMQGLLVRVARALNRHWNRRGPVFDDAYHARAVGSPREARHALRYVLNNAVKHRASAAGPDPFSSAAWFDGWVPGLGPTPGSTPAPVVRPRTWLLAVGWRRHGLIHPAEAPAAGRARARSRSVPIQAEVRSAAGAQAARFTPGLGCFERGSKPGAS